MDKQKTIQLHQSHWRGPNEEAILVIVRLTKSVFKLEREFDGSNPYMKGRNPIKMTKLVTTTADTDRRRYFVGHLGYCSSDKTRIQT